MNLPYSIVAAVLLCIIYTAYRRHIRLSLANIRGPKAKSFWLGSLPDIFIPECGVTEKAWQEDFGNVFRLRVSLGQERLWIADPKAMQHVFQTAAYSYRKPKDSQVTTALLLGRGLAWAEGDDHKRQRRVMIPAFGAPEAKAFLPLFRNVIEKVVIKWKDTINSDVSGKSTIVNIPNWLSKATLDAVGTAAFDYDFGALDDTENPLTNSYKNLLLVGFGNPSFGRMFAQGASRFIPPRILTLMWDHAPGEGIQKLRNNKEEVEKVAKKLLKDKEETEGGKDVLSLLVKANNSQNEKMKLRDDEMIPQMRTILLAGHETTSNSITWALYELARNPHIQDRVRGEIRKTEARASGGEGITATDFENMSYTVAFMKEVLRLYPPAFRMIRQATRDDVIPLFNPIVTKDGRTIEEVPVAKGTIVEVSVIGYNTNKAVWGEDAYDFNPERWLVTKERNSPAIGVYGNLFTFSGGVRSCIGYKFALIEIQEFLVTLLSNFEFSFPEDGKRIVKARGGAMTPMVEGETAKGAQMPMRVSMLSL